MPMHVSGRLHLVATLTAGGRAVSLFRKVLKAQETWRDYRIPSAFQESGSVGRFRERGLDRVSEITVSAPVGRLLLSHHQD